MPIGSPAAPVATDRSQLPITCLVLAQNSASIIARCIRSLAFADDILVIDGGSHDDTVSIATSLGARVIVNPWPGFAEQRRFAMAHARHDWLLVCDTDEEVTPALASEIAAATAESGEVAASH